MKVLGVITAGSRFGVIGLERFLKSFLYGVQPTDAIYCSAWCPSDLFLATSIASFVPAWRILRLNPADTLRAE